MSVAADEALEKALELARAAISEPAAAETAEEEPTEEPEADASELAQQADILMQQQKFAEAVPVLRKLTRVDGENGLAWCRLGYCLHATGKLDEAIGSPLHLGGRG